MPKTVNHHGVPHNVETIMAIKGQGALFDTTAELCKEDANTLECEDIKIPIVVKSEAGYLILLKPSGFVMAEAFKACLFSKHIIKKARIESKPVFQIATGSYQDTSYSRPGQYAQGGYVRNNGFDRLQGNFRRDEFAANGSTADSRPIPRNLNRR